MRLDIKRQMKTLAVLLSLLMMLCIQVFADSYTDQIDKCKQDWWAANARGDKDAMAAANKLREQNGVAASKDISTGNYRVKPDPVNSFRFIFIRLLDINVIYGII